MPSPYSPCLTPTILGIPRASFHIAIRISDGWSESKWNDLSFRIRLGLTAVVGLRFGGGSGSA